MNKLFVITIITVIIAVCLIFIIKKIFYLNYCDRVLKFGANLACGLNESTNSFIKSARNIKLINNTLEAELKTKNGNWKYNKIKLHDLLLDKDLENDNGIFKYRINSKEEDDRISSKMFPMYTGKTIPSVSISECVMLSIDIPKYNNEREKTLQILNNYKLPPIHIHFGYTNETSRLSKYYDFLLNKKQRNELTLGMLEIFENFVKKSKAQNEWLLYFEDDVRPINVNNDLTKLYNIPYDAELIRPYIGKNEYCNIKNISYNISYNGGLNHAFYISVSGCIKVLNYTKKYGWKHICDIDLYRIAKYSSMNPTRLDEWSLHSVNGNNDITEKLEENEKINMYHMSNCIFNQTSNPCV